ncbi:MAG TPA: hypothetical protein VKU41_06680 [Polyangiaceae bacterium]|nr:hypothetical protein [Polyangiaceae bacterium]
MPVPIGVAAAGDRSAREIASHSRAALDRPLAHPAEVWVAVARDEALVLGAFQRGAGMPSSMPLLRRASGGPEVLVGAGTVYVALALAHPAALEPSDARKIVNRSVRPLLRALTKSGTLAHFFGRDWVSVAHRPAAWVGFAHDATSGRTLFEAFVAVRAPFATAERASLLGKAPGTLEEIAGRPVDPMRVAAAVLEAYGAKGEARPMPTPAGPAPLAEEDLRADPPWLATADEAIGTIGAGPDARGALRIGGDLLVSRDALARLESRLQGVPDEDVGEIVDETLAAPGVALDGVRSLTTVRDVTLRARAAMR